MLRALLIFSVVGRALLLSQSAQPPPDKQSPLGYELIATVLDESNHPIAGAFVQIRSGQDPAIPAVTDGAGGVRFSHLQAIVYSLTVTKDGYLPVEHDVSLNADAPTTVELTMTTPTKRREQVDVKGTVDQVESSSAGTELPVPSAKELPSRPATVNDALPLLPGITRSPEGGLRISGTGEQRSALIVNSADVTDPATGQFGQTIPIDSVQTLNVFQTPFLAEYGRFTSGLVSVETRRGSETWKYELNDPLPDFRIRSYHLRGIRDATPRVNFEGPLMKGKLYFSEGLEYEIKKIPVITLPFPENQQKTEGFNSFSQVDYILAGNNLLTGTVHVAPFRQQGVNLSYFTPLSTSPDASTYDATGTLADKWTLGKGNLFENTLSFTRFTASSWGHGTQDLAITPTGDSGSYFAQQDRSASRTGLLSTYLIHPMAALGTHNLKFGSYFAQSSDHANVQDRPVDIYSSADRLVERIGFTPGLPIKKSDVEMAFFGQDHWLLSPRLALDAGLRVESQELSETFRVAPRLGVAWTPFASFGTTIRAGVGLFYDRVPLNVYGFAQYPSQIVTTYDAEGNIIGQPITYLNGLGKADSHVPLIHQRDVNGNFSPRSTNWSFQVEQPLTRLVSLRASYIHNQSGGLVILNPIAPEPGSNTGSMLLTGNGQSRYHQLEFTARFRLQTDKQQLFVSYVRSRARGDLNDFSNYLGNFPSPIVRPNQFANLSSNLPNRFLLWGLVHLPAKIQLAPIIEFRSGQPYAVTNETQAYVGVPYSTRYPAFLSVDSRISKDFQVTPKYGVRVSISGFNLTNHFNPDSVFNNTGASQYGEFFGQHKRRFMADLDFLF